MAQLECGSQLIEYLGFEVVKEEYIIFASGLFCACAFRDNYLYIGSAPGDPRALLVGNVTTKIISEVLYALFLCTSAHLNEPD